MTSPAGDFAKHDLTNDPVALLLNARGTPFYKTDHENSLLANTGNYQVRANYLWAMYKRVRVTRACDECRRRKIRCDGAHRCGHCLMYNDRMRSLGDAQTLNIH